MLTLTGNGRLARDVELRSTHGGDSVATVRVASDRRDRQADPVYVDLILWRGQPRRPPRTWSRARPSPSPGALSRARTRPATAARASPTSSTTSRCSTAKPRGDERAAMDGDDHDRPAARV